MSTITPGRLHAVEEAIHATLVRITAPESVGVSLRHTAGLLTGTIASLVGAVEEAQHEPNRSPVQYLPPSEVTDGHVDAYLKAYMQQNNQGSIYREAARAGLAAIQWPSQAIAPSPEMREVPWNLRRDGDTVTATWVKDEPMGADTAAFRIAGDGAGWLRDPVVTRPVSTLPTSGQVAYEAARTERLARRRSDEVISWDELNDGTRGMWEAAATAVLAGQADDGLEG